MLDSINNYSDLIIAVFTGLMFIVTFILVRENRLLRKAGTEPRVMAYLKPELGSYVPHVNLLVANLGQGSGCECCLSYQCGTRGLQTIRCSLLKHNAEVRVDCLPQGEQLCALLGTHELLGFESDKSGKINQARSPMPPFKVTVRYEDLTGKTYEHLHRLDVSHFTGWVVRS